MLYAAPNERPASSAVNLLTIRYQYSERAFEQALQPRHFSAPATGIYDDVRTNSTRRLFALPSGVSLEAIGFVSP